MFTHLHVRSHYSLLSGLMTVDKLVGAVADMGMDAVAITDTNNMYAAVELTVAAQKAGIKAIIGAEIRVVADMHLHDNSPESRKSHQLVLLVTNEIGYKNLMEIVTHGQLDGFHHEARVDKKLLARYSDGLIALSGWMDGEIAERLIDRDDDGALAAAREFAQIFGQDNFYLELQHHERVERQEIANEGCVKIAQELDLPLVATHSTYYLKPEDAQVQDIASCIGAGIKVDETSRESLLDFDLSLRTEEQMREIFADAPEAIDNTVKIAQRCNFVMTLGETQLPHYELPKGKTADEVLRQQSENSMRAKYLPEEITDEHLERLDYELGIITKTGYASYFLIVQDFVNWARAQGIVVGPGRGSAAGSFISYLTGITNIDPIKYKLLFERFLNPERVSMPDVDMDFADDRREEVLTYVRQKYGADHVAQIITFGTMAARAAVRDVGRALNYAYGYCDALSKMIPQFATIDQALEDSPEFKDIYAADPRAKQLIDAAKRLEGIARHTSVHACGVVITKDPVVAYTPMQRVARSDDDATVTQYASSTKFSSVEKIGLLKMDFLGLKNLTIIQNTLNIVRKLYGTEIDIEQIPLDDELAYKLFQDGRTTGVFQFESSGMKRYLKQLAPTVLEDIIAMVALYRPGPMDWIPDFIDNKHGRKKVVYLHPVLEPILADTYGVAIYQEQVMRIAQDLAGFTMGEADILRKAMGKKIMELIQEQKIKFVEGCITQGVGKKVAEQVFAYIEPFAGYGFNRSHAACYALIGYQTAYLKARYPAPFMAALMTSDQTHIDRIAIDVKECQDMDIEILPPAINESFVDFAVIGTDQSTGKIRFGLNAIKNVGHDVAKAIVAERKANGAYTDLTDFITRLAGRIINRKSIEALAKVGAFDKFAGRGEILHNIDKILAFAKDLTKSQESAQVSLFGDEAFGGGNIVLDAGEEISERAQLDWERELLGLYITGHPAHYYSDYLDSATTRVNDLAPTKDPEQEFTIGGIITNVHKIITKRGQQMLFVTIEDGTGAVECLVFPRTLEEIGIGAWTDGAFVLVTGKLSDKDDTPKILVSTVSPINDGVVTDHLRVVKTVKKHTPVINPDGTVTTPAEQFARATIILPDGTNMEIVTQLSEILAKAAADATDADTQIFIRHSNVTMQTPHTITLDEPTTSRIKALTGGINIIVE